MKCKILLCGKQKSFSRFLKYKFQDIIDFKINRNLKELSEVLNLYQAIVVVINSEEDLHDFLKIGDSAIPFVVCCFNLSKLNRLTYAANVFAVDTSMVKSKILDQISIYFEKTILSQSNHYAD